jgi:hypothetical protein
LIGADGAGSLCDGSCPARRCPRYNALQAAFDASPAHSYYGAIRREPRSFCLTVPKGGVLTSARSVSRGRSAFDGCS